ncbi:multicopper oxidase domain-containing protein [Vallitalea pronyensis]|uniref:Multicopper oxidase domain-containing protein n=1 Tax=Vallitalea pronyensis TaxID=1348613 RepID=A0A8J8SI36_9FIRM|nr:multicopper oxidase [Vallitalea pronyensis]QUI24088.1 multicopper oxidase domain-containing protein [Vallitalea pronyensis]
MALAKYVDKLPTIPTLKPTDRVEGADYYKIVISQFKEKLHRDLPPTTVWGFAGRYPGPIIDVMKNQWISIQWLNELPPEHLLPIDTTVHGAEPSVPSVRTVIHVHGSVVQPESDGYPDAWYTKDYKVVGPMFTRKVYDYPNQQPAATLWYHAHAIGITRLNVYAGLAGIYIIRNPALDYLQLPKDAYDMPLLIQDRTFNEDGSLYYPSQTDPPNPYVNPSVLSDYFAENILVNGKVWPYLEVEPRKYRFRIINGSNSRFYNMKLSSNQPFYQIGTDQGFLESPVVTPVILLAPAERAEVIIDFSGHRGEHIVITNDAASPYPRGGPVDPDTTGQIMQFRVTKKLKSRDNSIIPYHLTPIDPLSVKDAVLERDITLDRMEDEYGRALLLLDKRRWHDPIEIKPEVGTIEIWKFINLANSTHPIHIHLVRFLVLDRQPFDVDHYQATGEIMTTGPAVPPELNERGWKDTVRANPGELTRIIIKFVPYTGLYPWHCHILEHEDHEMMLPYEVIY